MINANMRDYDFYRYGDVNAYGQRILGAEPVGKVKLSISITSQAIQENINYKGASYLGLTYSTLLDDLCVIQYGEEKLKVLYVNPTGRLKQVFLAKI